MYRREDLCTKEVRLKINKQLTESVGHYINEVFESGCLVF